MKEKTTERCAECFEVVDEPIYNLIFKVGPPDHPATGMVSFECGGNPVGVCEDCLYGLLKERVEDWHI